MSDQIGIYKITNISNDKIYIGKSLLIKYRWKKHLWFLKKGIHVNKHLQSAFVKHGENSFIFDIIEYCNIEEVNDREKYWVSLLDSCNPLKGYNKTKGGDGLVATKEIKNKISKSLKGRKHSEERKVNQSKSHIGIKASNEQKINMSLAQKKHYQENPNRISKLRESLGLPIMQYSLEGIFICEFISAREAERQTNIDISSITKCCRGKGYKTAGGYIWKYKETKP